MSDEAASRLIDERIAAPGDWRGDRLAQLRALIREAEALKALVRAAVAANLSRGA